VSDFPKIVIYGTCQWLEMYFTTTKITLHNNIKL